jgi:uncharacterized membrane protein
MRLSERETALALFLLLVLPLVIFCAWRVPLNQVPDEATHIARANSVLNGELMGFRDHRINLSSGGPDAVVQANAGLALAVVAGNGANAPLPASASRAARLAWAEAIPWAPAPSFISCANTAAYAPLAYIPAALALGLAMESGASPHSAAIAARFGNVLAFALLGTLALVLVRRGRLLLLVVLGLPMTIWLAGSANQDGLLIAVTSLGFALLTRPGTTAFWLGSLLLAVLALQKPPFAAFMLLPLITPGPAPRAWGQRIGAALLIALPACIWTVIVIQHVSVPLRPGPPYAAGPLWPGHPGQIFRSAIASAQMQVVLHHPLRVALLPIFGPGPGLRAFWEQSIGIIGPFSIPLPKYVYAVYTLAMLSALAALLATPGAPARPLAFPVALFVALSAAALICLAQYLTWTPVGADRLEGIQGRYFIPLYPVAVLALGRVLRMPPGFGWVFWLLPVAAILSADIALPSIIAAHYYS